MPKIGLITSTANPATMRHILQDPRLNAAEVASRAFPDKTRETAHKALNRELRKAAPTPPHDAAIRHELGQLHHALNGARLLLAGATRQMAARQLLRDPRLTLRHFAIALFPDLNRNAATLRTRAIVEGIYSAGFSARQLALLDASTAELQAALAQSVGL